MPGVKMLNKDGGAANIILILLSWDMNDKDLLKHK